LEKKWENNETVHQVFTHFKKAYGTVKREVLNNGLMKSGVPTKLVQLVKTCLSKTYSVFRTGKHLSDNVPIQTYLEQGPRKTYGTETEWDLHVQWLLPSLVGTFQRQLQS
jgi:hypothetical protein